MSQCMQVVTIITMSLTSAPRRRTFCSIDRFFLLLSTNPAQMGENNERGSDVVGCPFYSVRPAQKGNRSQNLWHKAWFENKTENWCSQFSAAGQKSVCQLIWNTALSKDVIRLPDSEARSWISEKKWESRVLFHKNALHILHLKEIKFQLETFSPHCPVENHQK